MNITRVGIIVNPKAGNEHLHNQMEKIITILKIHFPYVSVLEIKNNGDARQFVHQLYNCVDLIIGAGGDGTIHEIINALAPLDTRPAFGIIPGGTCNDFSRALDISQDPLMAAKQICDMNFRAIDIGKCDHQYFLNFWGIGLITEVSSNINPTLKENFGRLSYYLSAIQSLNKKKTFHLKLESKQCAFEGNAAMVLIGNGPFTGGIRPFFPDSEIQDGKLEVLVIKSNLFQTFWDIFRANMAKEIPDSEGIVYFQTDHVSIQTTPPQTIDSDGERDFQTPSNVSVLRGHINMALGNSSSGGV